MSKKRLRRKQIIRNRRISLCMTILSYTEVRVDRGDTLWSIADRYMTEEYTSRKSYVREVQKLNNIGCDVRYGQRILVPYYSEDVK